MMRTLRWIALSLAVLLAGCVVRKIGSESVAASPPRDAPAPWYEREIAAFEAADREHPPAPGQALFVGSSSIRLWRTLAEDMGGVAVLNRGFGGSKTGEVLAVADRIVFPYTPSLIVYYCGDNDLGKTNTDSAAAANGFIAFAELVRRRLPETPILYLSIKPSIDRWSNWAAMARANELVRAYCERAEGVEYVDVASCLLGEDGAPNPALFAADGLHLNADGYRAWAEILRPRVGAHF